MENTGFGWVLLAVGIYGLSHSLLAAHSVKRWVEQAAGNRARRLYRLLFALFAGLGLVPLLGLAAWLPDQRLYAIPSPWLVLTLALQGLAGWGLVRAVGLTDTWAFIGLRQLGEPQPLIPQPGTLKLITRGAYRFVRHPLYSFSFVLLWLLPYMSWNILALVIGLSVYMLVGIWFEERKLLAEHGPEYEVYRKRTKILIPGVW